MPTKVIELEISEKITPVWVDSRYDDLAILVRFHKYPLGWARITASGESTSIISTEQLHQAIRHQLGSELIQRFMLHSSSPKTLIKEVLEPVSIIICTRDRAAQLEGCLKSIQLLDYPEYEVIIVDNAPSTDETANLVNHFLVSAHFPVRYVREEHLGIAWARNRGVAEARHKIIAFTDDDARVDRFWLRQIVDSFAESEVMAVTGFVAPAELETTAQRFFEFDYGGMAHGFQRQIIKRNLLTDQQMLWSCNFGVTANAAFRRQIFDEVGYFDVALRPNVGGEDIELFHRIVVEGHTMVYNPSVLVWHIHRRHLSALYQQIFSNCRSFGCYLLTCFRKRSVKRPLILRFWAYEWLCKWILVRLIRPGKLPRYLVLIELAGMLSSVTTYFAIQAVAGQTINQSSEKIVKIHQTKNATL